MGLASTTNRVDYTGNGATSVYAYTFKIFDEDHLVVTVRDTDNVETQLTKTTDYTVDGVGDTSGGDVTLVDASQDWLDGDGDLKSSYRLTIRRVVPLTQSTDIRNQGSFFPETHEDFFDTIVMIAQQLQEQINRCIQVPPTVANSDFDPDLPATVLDGSDDAIEVNTDGDGVELAS